MDDPVKMRYDLIRIYADLDNRHQQLIRNAVSADLLLNQIKQRLSEEQIFIIESAIQARTAVQQHMTELACTHLIMPAELTTYSQKIPVD